MSRVLFCLINFKDLELLMHWAKTLKLNDIMMYGCCLVMDYWPETPGVFRLSDLNHLLTLDNKTRSRNPALANIQRKALLVGIHELSHLRAIAWGGGQLIPDPPRLKGLAKQRYLDNPFQLYHMICYPLKTFTCFRIY